MEPTQAAIDTGIDVSKDRLDVAVHPSGEHFVLARDAAGLDALVARLTLLSPRVVALEASGGYESVVAAALAAAGLPVAVVNPAQVRSFARALGRRARDDGGLRRARRRVQHSSGTVRSACAPGGPAAGPVA